MTTLAATMPQETQRSRTNAALGMALFIGSWTMAFASLFLSLMILRHRQPVWPPEGVILPSFGLALGATIVLLASSALLHWAVLLGKRGQKGFALCWSLALGLALVFAGLQTWLWLDLMAAGRGPSSGIYESLFYGLTWFHALHVACGLIGLLWVMAGIASRRYGPLRIIAPQNVGVFWHFVDVVWLVLFVTLFIL